jgi:chemotaxis methyl-accepting protein methylase
VNSLLNRQIEDPVELTVRFVESLTGILIPDYRRDVVDSTLRRLGKGDLWAGLNRVMSEEPAAQRSLFDAITIPETYFFRHAGHYAILREYAAARLHARQSCHVLSAGCSTGEEAWSAAAVLASVFLPNANFSVTGWELSEDRVAVAKAGNYRNWSLRQQASEMQQYLSANGEAWTVSPKLRPFVHFYGVNLMSKLWPAGTPRYDAIFFRNVSIYWTRQQAMDVAERLATLLQPGGLFMVGPSDPISLPRSGWDVQMYNGVSAYRKRDVTKKPAPAAKPASRRQAPALAVPPAPVTPGPVTAIAEFQSEISALADRGEYEKALERVQTAKGLPVLELKFWEGILLLNLDKAEDAVHAFRYCVYLSSLDPSYHRWLATALDMAGRPQDAQREKRNADLLEQK